MKSAHDCSDGGLAVALAESCISQLVARNTPRLIGATVDLTNVGQASRLPSDTGSTPEPQPETSAATMTPDSVGRRDARTTPRLDALLFGETQSRVVVTCAPLDANKIIERAKLMGVPAARIGTVGGDKLVLKTAAGELTWPLPELHDLWWNSIARAMS